MLAEHAGRRLEFQPGGAAPAHGRVGGRRHHECDGDGQGGIAGLPNGLAARSSAICRTGPANATQLQNLDYGLVSDDRLLLGRRQTRRDAGEDVEAPTVGWAGWTSAAMTDVITRRTRAA